MIGPGGGTGLRCLPTPPQVPSSAAAESQRPRYESAVDRQSFQKLLEGAFIIQQSQVDSQSPSAIVEFERLITREELDEDGAIDLRVDRTTRNGADPTGAAIGPPGDEPPSAADSMDACFASFRVCPPEAKAALFRPRDPWTMLVILGIVLVLLMGWMLTRVPWQGTADTTGPPLLVSAKPDAVPAQPEESKRAEPSPHHPVRPKARSPEAPSGNLVVYQDGKVIFRLQPSEDVGSSSAKSEETTSVPSQAPGGPSATDPALGFSEKTNARVLQRVEPEYPEAARQQHIQGQIVLEAYVGKDGVVQQLTVISGNSMLATAASHAVLQWRFKPLVQDGRAGEFQTRIKVHFVLP